MHGIVIRNTGSHYVVKTHDSLEIPCKIKGNFRIKGIRTTNPIAVGDSVEIRLNPDGTAFITDVHKRKNYIIRRASNLSKESHIIAANIDKAFLIVTLIEPVTSTTFIDRFIATAEAYRIPVVIVINKVDLLASDKDMLEYLEAVSYLYRSIGYPVVHTSTVTGQGLNQIREMMTGATSLLSGNSGVGKSSIINSIIPGLDLRTAEISSTHHTGMHTTTFSEMFPIPDLPDSYLIDTPGVKGFGTIDFAKAEVSHYFPEIFTVGKNCRYSDCTHTHEPGCAVIEAVNDSLIAQSRYASYLSILDDCNPEKYRKAF